MDDYISEAMRRGDFDNLSGSGKPLNRDFNPMVDGFQRHLNKMLINNGYAPEWITLDKDIRYVIGLNIYLHEETMLMNASHVASILACATWFHFKSTMPQ